MGQRSILLRIDRNSRRRFHADRLGQRDARNLFIAVGGFFIEDRVRCFRVGIQHIGLSRAPNANNSALISPPNGRVKVRVIRTDEELMIARSVTRLLGPDSSRKT